MVDTATGCEKTERLLEFLLGDDAESRRLEAHLKDCEACSQEWESLRAWRAPLVAVAPQPIRHLVGDREKKRGMTSWSYRRAAFGWWRGGDRATVAVRSPRRRG